MRSSRQKGSPPRHGDRDLDSVLRANREKKKAQAAEARAKKQASARVGLSPEREKDSSVHEQGTSGYCSPAPASDKSLQFYTPAAKQGDDSYVSSLDKSFEGLCAEDGSSTVVFTSSPRDKSVKFTVKTLDSEFESEVIDEVKGDQTIMSRVSPTNSGNVTPQGAAGGTLGSNGSGGTTPSTLSQPQAPGRTTASPRAAASQEPAVVYLAQHFRADFLAIDSQIRKALFQDFLNFRYLEDKFGLNVNEFRRLREDRFQAADNHQRQPTKAEMVRLANMAKEVDLLLVKVDESVDDCMRQFARIRNQSVQRDTDALRLNFLQLKRSWGDEFQKFLEREIAISEQEDVQKLSMFRLKPLALSEFNGDLRSWPGFLDSWTNLVQSKRELTDSQKFSFLRSAVKGPAFRCIEHLQIVDKSLEEAWTILKQRYGSRLKLRQVFSRDVMEAKALDANAKLSAVRDFP